MGPKDSMIEPVISTFPSRPEETSFESTRASPESPATPFAQRFG
jgi:hypothetical protein